MAEDEHLYCEHHLISLSDPSSSMVVIRESSISDHVDFPPIDHENLVVASSIYGVDKYLESASSPSSSSRRSGSSSSFSSFPSDSDGQPSEFDRKSPSETDEKSPPSLDDESPPFDSDEQLPFEQKSPPSPSKQGGHSDGKLLRKPLNRIFQGWWELLLVRVYSKLKTLMTWFSITLRPFYPVLAIVIWWWMRVRARRKRVKGATMDHLRAIKERDQKIVQLLHQIAEMNELLIKHHKDIVSRG